MPLIDGFGRKIDYLRLSVTDRCNFRCIYCMPAHGVEFVPRAELLTYDEIERVVKTLVELGIEKIRITGGEPTVRKDLLDLVRRIGTLSLKSFAMTTNGYAIADHLTDYRQAGLQRINISLDTLKKDRFESMARFDGFDRVYAAIWRAMESGLSPVKVNMVVMKGINDDEVLDFVELSRNHPLHVRFIEYMPSSASYGNRFQDERIITADRLKEMVSAVHPLRPIEESIRTGPAKMFTIDGFLGRVGFIDPYADHFCSSCNRIRLTSLGRLKWCLFSNDGLDLKTFLRSGTSDEDLRAWILQKIKTDKPEHHPLGISELVNVSTVFSQVGG